MKKFLFTTLPSNDLGLLTRSLPIALELSKSGHKIVFSSPARAPDKLIKDAGFENLTPRHPLYQLDKYSPAWLENPEKQISISKFMVDNGGCGVIGALICV